MLISENVIFIVIDKSDIFLVFHFTTYSGSNIISRE